MTSDNALTKTHITHLRKVYNALRMRVKLNPQATRLVLGDPNQKILDDAALLISQAISKLQNVK